MKKYVRIAALACAMLSVCSFVSCKKKGVEISFVQDGRETVVKTVKKGETLYDIPDPIPTDGYVVTWDRTDFTQLKEAITVNAVFTPNLYVINYKTEEAVRDCIGLQTVYYGEEFTLDIPSLDGWIFVGWKLEGTETFVENGKYAWAEDITLTAVWDVDEEYDYTYFY